MLILAKYDSIGFLQTMGAPFLGEAPFIGRLLYSKLYLNKIMESTRWANHAVAINMDTQLNNFVFNLTYLSYSALYALYIAPNSHYTCTGSTSRYS